ncbi:cob(I)yrinic acid a,c-diamide adenosyltransferase [Deferribacterales bacterium RsTz2092]|nr:cob(I)alamin adenolsyltransferase/cobinamide ATP-dependent adenolsyltransferase [Deferribacterales bacterium]
MHDNFDKGYAQIYTGDGKGKTTAAIGVTIRALGAGMKVFFCQFMKNNFSSEQPVFDKYKDQLTLKQFGTGKFVFGKPSNEEVLAAKEGFQLAKDAVNSGNYDLVVLDELNVAVSIGIVAEKDVLELIKNKPQRVEMILTGRGATDALKEAVHLVTEMREIKHYYKIGVPARIGIEK